MPKTAEMKVRPTPEQKRAYEAAADAARPTRLSLTQWVITACEEKLQREQGEQAKRKASR